MELFNVKATIEKLHSDKKNTDYIVVKVPLASDYTLTYFPKDAEKSIINRSDYIIANTINSNTSNDVDFSNFE